MRCVMNEDALITNDEKIRNEMCRSLSCYSVLSYLPFNDLTIQRFNVAKP
jgi:hypothetical protein